jgi:hypothetical protein
MDSYQGVPLGTPSGARNRKRLQPPLLPQQAQRLKPASRLPLAAASLKQCPDTNQFSQSNLNREGHSPC